MNGLAGILRFDGSPTSARELAAMTGVLAHRGLAAAPAVVREPVAIAGAVASDDGAVLLALAGRIDNRAELGDGTSDTAAVLQAYERWGADAIGRLLGDFALALWDERRGELVCARDFLGKHPFYFHLGARAFRFASEPQAVLADAAIPRRPNLGMIGEHLAGAVCSTRETLIDGLERLPPAHLMVIARDGTRRLRRYWSWDPQRTIEHPDDASYVEEFRGLFAEAVRVRLDPERATATELSGGLDSSAVLAVAAAMAPVDAYSLVFPGNVADESGYIRAVAANVGVEPFMAEPQPEGAGFYLEQARFHLDLPEPPNMAMHRVLYEQARSRGTTVVLTGKGADEWFTGSPLDYADRLRALRLRGLRGAVAEQRAVWPSHSALRQLVRDGAFPLLPRGLQERLQRTAERFAVPEWMPRPFCRQIELAQRIRPTVPRGPRLAAAHVAATLDDGWTVHVAECSERALASFGLQARSPFDDRRVVELALALPEALRQRHGTTKWLVRAGMAGLLPDAVRNRMGQVGFREVFFRELEAQGGGALFDDLAIADLGWVNAAYLRRAYDDFVARHRGGESHPLFWQLWNAVSVERWVRAVL